MSWAAIVAIIAKDVGPDAANKIDRAVRAQFRGCRITIPARDPVTPEQLDAVAPGQPRKAAQKLGIHPSTAYRALRRQRLVR